jgi:hypothetical protein
MRRQTENNEVLKNILNEIRSVRPVQPQPQLFETPEKPADLDQKLIEKRAKLTPELEKSLAFAPQKSAAEKDAKK